MRVCICVCVGVSACAHVRADKTILLGNASLAKHDVRQS